MTGPREDTHSTESKAFHSDSHDEHKPLILENELSSKRSSWYTLTHSPYPVYLTMMLYFAPLGMNNVTMNSLMYNKLCYIKFNNLTLCTNPDFTHGHPALQQDQAAWMNYISLTEIPLSIITNLMLSSYCDKVGHKLPLLLPTIGSALASSVIAILATPQLLGAPLSSTLLYAIFYSGFGGYSMVMMSGFSYVAFITPPSKQSFAMAMSEGTLLVGVLIGNSINGVLADRLGVANMAYISVSVTPRLITFFFMADERKESTSRLTGGGWRWRDVIGFSNIISSIKCVFKRRKGRGRILLLLTFVIYAGPYFSTMGYGSASFLYYAKEQGFTISQYSVLNGYRDGMKGIGGAAILYSLQRWLKPECFNLMIGANAVLTVGYLVMSISALPASAWMGATLHTSQTLMTSLLRALQTSLCDKDEYGRMFAFDALFQVVTNQVVAIGFKSVYAATVVVWPEFFFVLCAIILILTMIVVTVEAIIKDSHDKLMYSVLDVNSNAPTYDGHCV